MNSFHSERGLSLKRAERGEVECQGNYGDGNIEKTERRYRTDPAAASCQSLAQKPFSNQTSIKGGNVSVIPAVDGKTSSKMKTRWIPDTTYWK